MLWVAETEKYKLACLVNFGSFERWPEKTPLREISAQRMSVSAEIRISQVIQRDGGGHTWHCD